jgi:hypothetical protein
MNHEGGNGKRMSINCAATFRRVNVWSGEIKFVIINNFPSECEKKTLFPQFTSHFSHPAVIKAQI